MLRPPGLAEGDQAENLKGLLSLQQRSGDPMVVQFKDILLKQFYISYDRNRATCGEILLARFTEQDILAREFQGPQSKSKILISRPQARDAARRKP